MKIRTCAIVATLLLISSSTFGQQVGNASNAGTPENAAFSNQDIDSVQVNNGNLNIVIPLWETPGRAGLNRNQKFYYSSKGFYLTENCDTSCIYHVVQMQNNRSRVVPQILSNTTYSLNNRYYSQLCSGVNTSIPNAFVLTEPDGTQHHFQPDPQGQDGCSYPWNTTRYADDGSGWMITPNGTLRKDGSTFTRDSNGNLLYDSATSTNIDTLGRAIPVGVSYYDAGGTLRTIQITYQTQTISTHLCGILNNPNGGVGASTCSEWSYSNSNAPHIITLANGLSYTINYNSGDGGEISSITLPTGATISYTYATFTRADGTLDPGGRRVMSRTVTIGGQSATWNYSYSGNTTTVVDPYSNQIVYTCTAMDNGSGMPTNSLDPGDNSVCQITDVNFYSGSSTLLKTVHTDYWNGATVLPKAVTTTTYSTVSGDSTVTKNKVEMDYDSEYITAQGLYFTRGNVIEKREYAYDSAGANPQLIRKTDLSYLHQSNSTYSAANIANRVTDKIVYDCTTSTCIAPGTVGVYGTPYSGGTRVAETLFNYDGTPLTDRPGAPAHDTSYGTGNTLRGNLTQIKRWLNTGTTTSGSGWLITDNAYDILGNLISTTDAGDGTTRHTTTFSYSDDWGGTTSCLPASNSYAYLTSVLDANNHEHRKSYFACSGQVKSEKGQNDINASRAGTTFTYDSMKRLLTRSASDGGLTTYSYNDVALTATATVKVNSAGTVNVQTESDFDTLGRVKRTALLSDPDGVTYTDISYDKLGRKLCASNPYRNTTEVTYGQSCYEYDALGRMTKTIPQDGSTYTNNVLNTYGGNYTITADEAGKQRKRVFDGLGRLTEVDEPGPITTNPTPSTGSFTISGSEQIQTTSGVKATGTVTISGSVRTRSICDPRCNLYTDQGDVWITVNGFTATASYNDTTSTASTLAAALASIFSTNPSSPVTATSSGGTVTMTSKAAGPNYSFSSGSDYSDIQSPTGIQVFTSPSFTTSNSGSTLVGGVYPTNAYDTGNVNLTVAGYTATVAYGQSSTPSSLATALAAAFTNDLQSPVTATASGSTVNVTSRATGSSTNYALNWSSNSTQGFSPVSFTASTSGATMTGGIAAGGGLAAPARTAYTYDALDNILSIQQKGFAATCDSSCRSRSFIYDSTSRLLTSNNPESGQLTFTYDPDGNILTKTSPRPNQFSAAVTLTISYSYDIEHRLTGKTYSNGDPSVSYSYDQASYNTLAVANGIDQRTGMSDASGSTAWTYDSEERPTTERRTLSSITKDITYSYNVDGSVASLIYPSGRTVTYTPGASGRALSAVDSANSINYLTAATYAADGSLLTAKNGYVSGGFAGISISNSYNKRFQPIFLQAASPTATIFSLGYDFGLNTKNNGDVYQLVNNKDTNRSQTFTYDELNRLVTAQTSSSANWGNSYLYDIWGNLLSKTVTKGTAENLSVSVGSTNQITGYCYDAAGNLQSQSACPSQTYTYDGENRISTAGGLTYTYDAEGNRVKKSNGKLYWWSNVGQVLSETDAAGNTTEEYVFFSGQRIARRDNQSAAVHYYYSDFIHSTGVVASAGGVIEQESDYFPWGGERVIVDTTPTANNFKFSGKERDPETGLDNFGARYYAASLGRWLTPDWSINPIPVPYAQYDNPHTLNLYTYVADNPTSVIDKDGHLAEMASLALDDEAFIGIGQWGFWGPPGINTSSTAIFMQTQGAAVGLADKKAKPADNNHRPKQQGVASKERFKTKKAAAKAAGKAGLAATNKTGTKWEYGGDILRDANGTFTYTLPVTFQDAQHYYADDLVTPEGFERVATYHTHPHHSKYEGEGLSVSDEGYAYGHRESIYEVDTFSRNLYVFTPRVSQFKPNEFCCGIIGDKIGHIE